MSSLKPNQTPRPIKKSTGPSASASPQIRAALAALRNKSQPETPTPRSPSPNKAALREPASPSSTPKAVQRTAQRTTQSKSPIKPPIKSTSSSLRTPAATRIGTSSSSSSSLTVNKAIRKSPSASGLRARGAKVVSPARKPPPPKDEWVETSRSAVVGGGGQGGGLWLGGSMEDSLLPPIGPLIEKARTTGHLNISSRSMQSLPSELWTLLPASSPYHPANMPSPPSQTSKSILIDFNNYEPVSSSSYYNEKELKTLKVATNELTTIASTIGEFKELEHLDLHNNQLPHLPRTLLNLELLTTLDVSSNKLVEFPVQFLALKNLTSLDLSANMLSSLWSQNYTSQLDTFREETVKEEEERKAALRAETGDESFGSLLDSSYNSSGGFFAGFAPKKSPSVPPVRAPSPPLHRDPKSAPWPQLTNLKLIGNKLSLSSLEDIGSAWPVRLVTLELDGNLLGLGKGDAANVMREIGGLERLEKLSIRNNELSDAFFVGLKGDQEGKMSAELNRWPCLKELDLSKNEIDSTAGIEGMLGIVMEAKGRRAEYRGLPDSLSKLVKATMPREGDGVRNVNVGINENFLKDEGKRRREMLRRKKASRAENKLLNAPQLAQQAKEEEEEDIAEQAAEDATATIQIVEVKARSQREDDHQSPPPPYIVSEKELTKVKKVAPPEVVEARRKAEKLAWEVEAEAGLLTAGGRRRLQVEQCHKTDKNSSQDELNLVYRGFNDHRHSLNLGNNKLEHIPVPSNDDFDRIEPKFIDLSKNLLKELPFDTLAAWGWRNCLRDLDISRNKVAAVQLTDWLVDSTGRPRVAFANLESLNLSGNSLSDHVKITSPSSSTSGSALFFDIVSVAAPNLKRLDLTLNFFTSCDGLQNLLMPENRKGLEWLGLSANKIADLAELVTLAESIKEEGKGEGWRCDEVDLRDNEINRLPPALGFLPLHTLSVTGNTFRVPHRRVYEVGGTKELLTWLRNSY